MPKPTNNDFPESKVTADPNLEKRTRRNHSYEYKVKMVAAADACQHGELGQLLRREGLYSGQIRQWREELASGNNEKLSKSKPGPAPMLTPDQRKIEKLLAENIRLKRELEISNGCIELQKKALQLLDLQSNGKKP